MTGPHAHAAARFGADLARLLEGDAAVYVGVGAGRGRAVVDLLQRAGLLQRAWLFGPHEQTLRDATGQRSHAVMSESSEPDLDAWFEGAGLDHLDVLDLAAGPSSLEVLHRAGGLLTRRLVRVVSVEVGLVAQAGGPPLLRDVARSLAAHRYVGLRLYPLAWDDLADGPVLRGAFAAFVPAGPSSPVAGMHATGGALPAAAVAQHGGWAAHRAAMTDVAIGEARQLVEDILSCHAALQEVRAELAEASEQLAAQRAAFAAERAASQAHLTAQIRHREDLQGKLDALLASRSWQLSAPVRAAGRLGQRLRGQPVSPPFALPPPPQPPAQTDEPDRSPRHAERTDRSDGPPGHDRFLGLDGRQRRVSLRRARNWLWSGYAELGRRWLAEIAGGGVVCAPADRVEAARILAVWHAKRREDELALSWLQRCRALDSGSLARRDTWLVQAQVLAHTGRLAHAEMLLASRRTDPRDASVLLLTASIAGQVEPTAESQVEAWRLLSEVYLVHGLLPVTARDPHEPWSIDNVTTVAPPQRRQDDGPLVSVILPAHNAAATLATALRALLEQTWGNLEILVVDDASEDTTSEVARRFADQDRRVKVLALAENRGAFGARNAGLEMATGAYVTVHDADDWSHAEKIEAQVDLVRAGAPFALSDMVRVAEPLVTVGPPTPGGSLLQPNPSSALMRRDDLLALEGWDDRARITADAELLRRLALRHRLDPELPGLPRAHRGCPLSLVRRTTTSLTGRIETHASTVRFGVRREYREASEWWYARATGDPHGKTITRSALDFPVPTTIRRHRVPRIDTDVLILTDTALDAALTDHTLTLIAGAQAGGLRVALRQVPWWRQYPMRRRVPAAVRERLYQLGVPLAAAHEEVAAEGVLLTHPALFEYRYDGVTTVQPRWAALTVGEFSERTRDNRQALYDPQRVADTLAEVVAGGVTWVAASATLRRRMDADPRFPAPAAAVWTPLLDLTRWQPRPVARSRVGHTPPVLGRSSGEDRLAWPATSAQLREAYCAAQPWTVRLRGGSATVTRLVGDVPGNWQLLPDTDMLGEDTGLAAFLSTLDFYVALPHESAIAPTDRAVLTAMAAGVPVILPPGCAEQFGDAALYAAPGDVAEVLSATWADVAAYAQRVEAGLAYVRRRCDLARFADRLAALTGQ